MCVCALESSYPIKRKLTSLALCFRRIYRPQARNLFSKAVVISARGALLLRISIEADRGILFEFFATGSGLSFKVTLANRIIPLKRPEGKRQNLSNRLG